MIIEKEFYLSEDVVEIARNLIGKHLFTKINGEISGGIITETEAYEGVTDKASHAYSGRKTKRTEIMFREGGIAYIYLCYGIHSLFNIVTNKANIPHAILIRGIYPTHGLDLILNRMNKKSLSKNMINGPGKVSKALNINYSLSGIDLKKNNDKNQPSIWLENNMNIPASEISVSKRIGIDYAEEDALLPYRFFIEEKLIK
ncbi:MAG: DNA-3-methyladenine glycosylase [Bacteroidales bacterium]|nr:DNA-3-methyladenine glycosylase [Bacteroidales bacterium]